MSPNSAISSLDAPAPAGAYSMSALLRNMVAIEASDLHLAAGRPPVVRVNGKLGDVEGPALTKETTQDLIYGILNDAQKQKFEENKELDFSLSIANLSRFRVNVHWQRGSVAAAFRGIATNIRTFEDLNLPGDTLRRMCRRPNGFVLVTGPTGSGKSTTLAAMIDMINREFEQHLITVEDPIEFLHPHKKCLIEQREVNEDTHSFANALKYALRQDPDILMIGEMRDQETISAALTAAETGHLVFSTLHTPDVIQTCDRIVDVFPPHQQEQVRVQLAGAIEGILSQRLIPSADGGRVIALEILIATDAVRNQIREGMTPQLATTIEANGKMGMVTMDRSLTNLYHQGKITRETALLYARKPDEMKRFLYR